MARILTFGELLLRLSPPGAARVEQASAFDVAYGGSEANVAALLARFGHDARYLTRVPDSALGRAALASLKTHGVDTSASLRGGPRLGLYILEQGAGHRPSSVLYDRAGSSFATIDPVAVDWRAALEGVDWLHWSGITPALSPATTQLTLTALAAARSLGVFASCDLNLRARLWTERQPEAVLPELLAHCDLILGNEAELARVLGWRPEDAQVPEDSRPELCRKVAEAAFARFPRCQTIVTQLRRTYSPRRQDISATLHRPERELRGPTYSLDGIVDRVGAGDALCGALIHGLASQLGEARALDLALAASALAHSIPGDVAILELAEVEALADGAQTGRIQR